MNSPPEKKIEPQVSQAESDSSFSASSTFIILLIILGGIYKFFFTDLFENNKSINKIPLCDSKQFREHLKEIFSENEDETVVSIKSTQALVSVPKERYVIEKSGAMVSECAAIVYAKKQYHLIVQITQDAPDLPVYMKYNQVTPLQLSLFSQKPQKSISVNTKRLCGWYNNPKRGIHSLTDAQGEWKIANDQEKYVADNIEELGNVMTTKMALSRWIQTDSKGHGYTCACIDAEIDDEAQKITVIREVKSLPISRCKNDDALPQENRY